MTSRTVPTSAVRAEDASRREMRESLLLCSSVLGFVLAATGPFLFLF